MPPNASWLYYRPEGNILLHFMLGRGSGWRLVPSLDDIYRNLNGPSPDLYESRMGLDPRLGTFALRLLQDSLLDESNRKLGGMGYAASYDHAARLGILQMQIDRERRLGRQEIQRAMLGDSDPLHFE